MSKFYEYVGTQINRWLILEFLPDVCRFDCECQCSKKTRKPVNPSNVINGLSRSCGCLISEKAKERAHDLQGQEFGRLLVLSRAENHIQENGRVRAQWNCICQPDGETLTVRTEDLLSGNTKSCGCLNKESIGNISRKHGLSTNILYKKFRHIIDRCRNPNVKAYKYYGGRGIEVHQPWVDDRELFVKYMEDNFPDIYDLLAKGHQIDRPNTNGNYEPGNVRPLTQLKNANNKRNNRIEEAFEVTDTLANLVRQFGRVAYNCVLYRLKQGWHIEKALTWPTCFNGKKPLDFDKPGGYTGIYPT